MYLLRLRILLQLKTWLILWIYLAVLYILHQYGLTSFLNQGSSFPLWSFIPWFKIDWSFWLNDNSLHLRSGVTCDLWKTLTSKAGWRRCAIKMMWLSKNLSLSVMMYLLKRSVSSLYRNINEVEWHEGTFQITLRKFGLTSCLALTCHSLMHILLH